MKQEEENSRIYNTNDIYDFYSKYHTIWNNELDIVYEKLMYLLTVEAKEMLEKSQIAWEEENANNSKLWLQVFDATKGRGSGDATMILIQNIDRIRIRTFLLAEYYYWLTGDFAFEYRS